jgi:uncharacterized SAM-binding protein YcdF (DUF218 family)
VDAFAELTKSLLIPGTLTFLLFGVTIGLALAWGPAKTRRFGLPWITVLVLSYWIAAIPRVADTWATRFHAADSRPLTAQDGASAQAIVVLGAGIRTTYVAGNHAVAVPDPQTIYNALEGARLYHLLGGRLPVLASGGRRDGAPEEATESGILKEWLVRAGVPGEQIVLESGSRTTREQASLVAPILKDKQWLRVLLVTPAVQGPRARQVFRLQGIDAVSAPAPFWPQETRDQTPGWIPTGGALRASERATYDYLAWGYYWIRGWLG